VGFKPESLLGAEALAVFLNPEVGREGTPGRGSILPPNSSPFVLTGPVGKEAA
jgi:hypothetical protein